LCRQSRQIPEPDPSRALSTLTLTLFPDAHADA
jgi:hypothetical protein